jgi:hypothetical protein
LSVEYYFGFFSPALIVLSLGIYHFGQSTHRGDSFVMPLGVIASFALLASLTAAEVIDDVGLFSGRHGSSRCAWRACHARHCARRSSVRSRRC